jgi:hypothetical protein
MHMRALWLVVLAVVVVVVGAVISIGGDDPAPGTRAAAESDAGAESEGEAEDEAAAEREAEARGEVDEEEEEEGLGPAEPDDYFLFQRSTGRELPSAEDFTRSVRQARTLRRATARAARQRGPQWTLEGPTNIGGRLVDLAVDPFNADTVFVAAAKGGVWETTDGSNTL